MLHLWLPLTVGAIAFGGEQSESTKQKALMTRVVKTLGHSSFKSLEATNTTSESVEGISFEARYHKVWKHVKKHFLYAKRLANWDRWEHRFDGRLTSRKEFDEAVQAMLESLNDDFTYMRSRVGKPATSPVLRANASNDLECCMLNHSVAYLKLCQFYDANLPAKMELALRSMRKATSYVIDLRDNQGGVIDIAFESFGLLANEGVFTMYRGNNDTVLHDNQDMLLTKEALVRVLSDHSRLVEKRLPNLTEDKPIVVLVDENTRSAAEMLTGALREERGAIVIGSRTFGKGVLQDVLPCDEESDIKVTCARFFLPNGECIHEAGIAPDCFVTTEGEQIQRAIEIALSLSKSKKENPPL